MQPRAFVAKLSGQCATCGERFDKGVKIKGSRNGYGHENCVEGDPEWSEDDRIDNPGAYGKSHHMCD